MASLAHVLYPPPDRDGWAVWAWHHAQHHEAIERSMAQVLGVEPVIYPLYPYFKNDHETWVLNHVNAHSRFCELLGIAGQDLSNLDFNNKSEVDSWLNLNFLEHLAAAQRVGTTIT